MVYTEYFVKGTEPEESCLVHGSRSIFSRVAGWVGAAPAVPAQNSSVEDRHDAVREATVAEGRPDQAPPEAKPAEPKKRGFWSRVFGSGKKKN